MSDLNAPLRLLYAAHFPYARWSDSFACRFVAELQVEAYLHEQGDLVHMHRSRLPEGYEHFGDSYTGDVWHCVRQPAGGHGAAILASVALVHEQLAELPGRLLERLRGSDVCGFERIVHPGGPLAEASS